MDEFKRISFDTSAINTLASVPDRNLLVARINTEFRAALTFPSVAEPLATRKTDRRSILFDLLESLLKNGECVQAHHIILTQLVYRNQRYGISRWDRLDIRFPECERAVVRRNFSEKESQEERLFALETEATYKKTFEDVRPIFKKVFDDGEECPPTFTEFTPHLTGAGGAFWKMSANLYERASQVDLPEEQIREFIEDCPPFHALVLGIFCMEFEWAITEIPAPKHKRVGKTDTFSAVYLPYCDVYVTDDARQRKYFKEIVALLKLSVEVWSVEDLKSYLLPRATLVTPA